MKKKTENGTGSCQNMFELITSFYMEGCNLVYKVRKKVLLKMNAQKQFWVTDGNQIGNPLITGQMLYSLSYRDSHMGRWITG